MLFPESDSPDEWLGADATEALISATPCPALATVQLITMNRPAVSEIDPSFSFKTMLTSRPTGTQPGGFATPSGRGVRARLSIAILMLLPGLVSCWSGAGDGKSPVIACAQYNAVSPGFTGDLNRDGPGGGGDGGGDAAGSAGVGGGLGKVLGAKVEVFRLADGLRFGDQEVFTDKETGLVTIQTCDVKEPMLIILKGVEGATYYDEGKNALLPFGPEQEIHALVSEVDGNIGVSALTEAAYRYAINNFLADPKAIANGSNPQLKTTDLKALSKLTAQQMALANQAVLKEVNRVLPANYALTSITALPTPLGLDNQRADLIPENRYGQAAVVTGAFSWMADKFRIGNSRPTLDMIEEFSRDLTDGQLNSRALDGSVASFVQSATYDSVNIPIHLNVGANYIGDQFSSTIWRNAAKYVDVTAFNENQSCNTTWNRFALTKQGTIELNRQRYKKHADPANYECIEVGSPMPDPEFTKIAGTNIKEIFTSHESGGGFFVKDDGGVFSWGNSTCGQLGDGEWVGIRYEPMAIRGLKNVTSLASGQGFSIARDNNGDVYSWGSSKFGVLGLGEDPKIPNAVPCTDLRFGTTTFDAAVTPQRIPGLSNITQVVVAHFSRVFAIDNLGQIYNWGFGCGRQGHRIEDGGTNDWIGTPQRLNQPTAVRAIAAKNQGCFAVKADGSLVGWGFYNGIKSEGRIFDDGQWFGDGQTTAKVQPTTLPGLSDVREIASDKNYFYALKADGTLWRWGGILGEPATIVKKPTQIVGIPSLIPGQEVRFRHIKSDPDGARLFAQDGRIFAVKVGFKNTLDSDKIVVDATGFWGFK